MKKIKCWIEAIFALFFLCAPVLLMIIGIWMIYNIDLFIGLVIGFIGFTGAVYEWGLILEKIESMKTIK